MKNLKDFTSFSNREISIEESNYPPGAESDPNAPWNREESDLVRVEQIPASKDKFEMVASDYSEFAILKEKESGKLYLVAFDTSDPEFKDFLEVPRDFVGRDEDGDPEYDYRWEDAEIDDSAITNYATSQVKSGKKGQGLYSFESGEVAEIDEELAKSMTEDLKKWAADPRYNKGGIGKNMLKMAEVLDNMLKEIK
jgi:hypothetical protein